MRAYITIGALVASFVFGGYVQGNRVENRWQAKELARKDKNMEAVLENQQSTLDAIQAWQKQSNTNEVAYAQLNESLVSLRGTVSGLRGEFPGLIRDASEAQLRAYATTCTAVFDTMARAGADMAEAGARIARQADLHAADAALIAQGER